MIVLDPVVLPHTQFNVDGDVIRWVKVSDIIDGWSSCDLDDYTGEGVWHADNLQSKRDSYWGGGAYYYAKSWGEFLKDVRTNGYRNPMQHVDRYGSDELGNGHHRFVAAIDLGLTHVPVLYGCPSVHDDESWETSGGNDRSRAEEYLK